MASLVLLAANDDFEGRQSAVTFTAQAGVIYIIQVDGYGGTTGAILLNHPISSSTGQPPVITPNGPPKLFFRVGSYPAYDADADGDSLVSWEERMLGSNPNSNDSDSDTLPDGWEFIHQFNPVVAADAAGDADADGISNLWEYKLGYSPRLTDSNGNGMNDASEDKDSD